MSGIGKYLDHDKKIGQTEIPTKSDEEIRQGMQDVLDGLKEKKDQEKKRAGQNMKITEPSPIKFINGVPLAWIDGLAKVIEDGAKKHGYGSYLDPDNPSLTDKSNYASKSRHAAKSFAGQKLDDDSGLHHELHEACRALMKYERYLLGIET